MRRALIVAAVGMCADAVAHAQPDLSPLQRPSRPMIEAAQQHYLSGTRFFEAGSWDAALVEFSASFQLSGERDRRVGTRCRAGLRRSVSEGISPNPTCPFR